MPTKKKVCIVGGGATGAALLWALSQDATASQEWDITLIHEQPSVGGHSLTFSTVRNGETLYIDVGVQFISLMLYPNVHVMLQRPDFQSVAVRDYNELQIACAFPKDAAGNMQNWGNFPAYQSGPQFATLYNSDVQNDIGELQAFIEGSLPLGWGLKSLADYFANPPVPLSNPQQFINYFVAPYMSIINGYGSALLDQTIFYELFPLFGVLPLPQSWGLPTPLGSFFRPGVGWQRFAKGAQSWVEAMADAALKYAPSSNLIFNAQVTAVSTDPATGQVTVQWTDQNNNQNSDIFDKVVLTTDMWTNSKLLNNSSNQYFWNNLYEKYVGYGEDQNGNPLGQPIVWDLMYGACYIHTDENMLSPDLRDPIQNQKETNQFNAYYASTGNGSYDLTKTFTTYIQKNVLGTPSNPDMNADGIYLTMYGYVPQPGDTVPAQSTWLTDPIIWTHGKWTPAAMGGPKSNLHLAQGLGNISYPGQINTNVYFAGNNTTVDSEEGGLVSALAIANYAFGVNYPLFELSDPAFSAFALEMYGIYHNVMFPKQNASHAIASLYQVLPEKGQPAMMASPMTARSQVKLAVMPKKSSTATKKKIVAKKVTSRLKRAKSTAAKKVVRKAAGRKLARTTLLNKSGTGNKLKSKKLVKKSPKGKAPRVTKKAVAKKA